MTGDSESKSEGNETTTIETKAGAKVKGVGAIEMIDSATMKTKQPKADKSQPIDQSRRA